MVAGSGVDLQEYLLKIAQEAKDSSYQLASLTSEKKNRVLDLLAATLVQKTSDIMDENKKDLEFAQNKGLTSAMCDRLRLDDKRIRQMADGVKNVIKLPDPVGNILKEWDRPNGLMLAKVRVPLGVIAMIYESRPNVTIDAASLCIKSGNAVILKGGSEAFHSNKILSEIFQDCLRQEDVNCNAVQFIATRDRAAVDHMLKLDEYINVVIPRGGSTLIRKVTELSRIPVIKHYDGICHVYVDKEANLEMAKNIVLNAKIQRPGVCNAMETLLIHKDLRESFLLKIVDAFKESNVEIRGDQETIEISSGIKLASNEDWSSEYLDLIISIRLVDDITDAVKHINKFGSQHTDAIVTDNKQTADLFLNSVDSSTVLHNASTRFSDGFEFGFGAEMGISTDKLHARGPVGLEELTTYKYIVRGDGQVRE